MNKLLLCVAVAGSILLLHKQAYAGETSLEPKSVGLAVALGLDPIPGDALFYAEKPAQGAINMVLGGIGGGLFWYGLIKDLTHNNTGCTCSDLSCCDWSGLRNGLLMAAGGVLYFPALIWDAIGGIAGVKKHNARIEKKYSFLNSCQPTLAIAPDGVFVGAQFRF